MFKARLILSAVLLSGAMFAQESSKISSAIIAFKRPDMAEAKLYIDQADSIVNAKNGSGVSEKNMQKLYFNRGLIYQTLYNREPNIEDLNIAIESYQKLIAYEIQIDDDDYTEQAQRSMIGLLGQLNNFGYDQIETDEEAAYQTLERVYALKQDESLVGEGNASIDTLLLYNMASLAPSKEVELAHYKTLIEYGYTGMSWSGMLDQSGDGEYQRVRFASKEQLDQFISRGMAKDPERTESINPKLYAFAAFAARDMGDTAQFDVLIKEGRAAHPNDSDLLRFELQTYLDKGDYESALSNLEAAAVAEPTNPVFFYNIGYIYHQEKGDKEKGLEYYQKAVALDSSYVDPLYMAGLVYVEKSNDISSAMNDLPRNAQTRYDEMDKEKDDMLNEALTYFLLAEEQEPNDLPTVQSLSKVYFKLGIAEKALEYNAKYKELEAAQEEQ